MKDILIQGLAALGLSPSPEAIDRLCRYSELLLEQNKVMNLTAITEPEQVARLHFLDSAAILSRQPGLGPASTEAPATPEDLLGEGKTANLRAGPEAEARALASTWLAGRTVIDVGTGAGFPGMVLKLLEPSLSLTLADSLGKRVTWLENVCEALSLDGVRCLHARAEELALEPGFRDSFDIATSRAVASFPLLCELCLPFVKVGGVFLAMKSVESAPEVRAGENAVKRLGGRLLPAWDYTIPGTEVTHRIVAVEKVAPTPKGYPRSWGKIKKTPL